MVTGPELTSTRAPRVKAAQRLAKRAFRARDRRFLAEGPQAVARGARRGAGTVARAVRHRGTPRRGTPRSSTAAEAGGAAVHLVSGEVMAALTQTVTPAGAGRGLRLRSTSALADVARRPRRRLLAVLAHARDPGNAGTVVRAADAAGAGGVLLTGDSVDPYNGKCVRATAGSAVPPAGRRRAAGWRTTCRPCGRPACGCSPPTATADLDLDDGGRPGAAGGADRVGLRQRGLGPAASRPGRSPTPSSGCRSTAGPSR